jgi:hypothetical protein
MGKVGNDIGVLTKVSVTAIGVLPKVSVTACYASLQLWSANIGFTAMKWLLTSTSFVDFAYCWLGFMTNATRLMMDCI